MKALVFGLSLLAVAQFAEAREYAWDAKAKAYCATGEKDIYVCSEEGNACEPECYGPSEFLAKVNEALSFGTPVTYYYCGSNESGVQETPCAEVTPGSPAWLTKLGEFFKAVGFTNGNQNDWMTQESGS